MFKSVLSIYLLASTLPGEPDANGWVAIERRAQGEPVRGADERDSSIWVIFSKQIGPEKILVSFPEEPKYRYLGGSGGQMEIFTTFDGADYRLKIEKEQFSDSRSMLSARKSQIAGAIISSETENPEEKSVDLTYWKDGFWVLEHFVQTNHHTYLFQTKSSALQSDSHLAFFRSLDIEKDRNFHDFS